MDHTIRSNVDAYELQYQFNRLQSDAEKWEWLLANKHHPYTVYLDNDDTFVIFAEETEEENAVIGDFFGYIGWTDCVLSLLQTVGINAEQV